MLHLVTAEGVSAVTEQISSLTACCTGSAIKETFSCPGSQQRGWLISTSAS